MRIRKQSVARIAWLAVLLWVWGCIDPFPDDVRSKPYEWQTARPVEQGLDSLSLARAHARAADIPGMHSLLVARNGYLVAEHYYNGHDKYTIWHTRSVTKTIISALVGIALEKGYLDSVDQPIAELLPAYLHGGLDSAKRDITLRHLLTMTAGLEWDENGTIQDQWSYSRDWLAFTAYQPMAYEPGQVFEYNSSLPHLLSGIITERTEMSTLDFANKYLFDSLGVTIMRWDAGPEGTFMGGFGLFLTPRDMARFGQLYVEGGTIDGYRILSSEWVGKSTRKQVNPRDASVTGYGYLWWRKILDFNPMFVALGAGGQTIYCIPQYNLVVVTTGDFFDNADMLRIDGFVEGYIIPAVRN